MNVVKPLLIAGSGGTIATGAYLTKDHGMPSSSKKVKEVKSIKDSLVGKKLISSIVDSEQSKKQGEAEFESDKDSIKRILGKDTLENPNGGIDLSNGCSNQMSLNTADNKAVLENVEKYCLIRSVSNQLSRKNKNLLKSDVADGGSETYKKRKTEDASIRAEVGLSDTGQEGKEEEELLTIKQWCSDNSSEEFLVSQDGGSSLYTKVLKGCTEEGE